MYHFAVTHINAHMGNIYIITGKKYQVAGLQVSFVYRISGSGLNVSRPGEADTLLGVNVLHKSRAVKTIGGRTAPDIRDAQKLPGKVYDAVLSGKVRFMGTYGQAAVEQSLIGCAADFAVDSQMIVILEFRYSSFVAGP